MKSVRVLRHLTVAIVAAALLPRGEQVTHGQTGPLAQGGAIASLAEPGESLTVRSLAADTGLVAFASTPGRGLLLPQAEGAPAVQRALAFVDLYGGPFGLADRSQVRQLRATVVDELGREHVRLQQVHNGIPVTAGELVVHLNRARVTAVNGTIVRDLPDTLVPGVSAGDAQQAARTLMEKHEPDAAANARYSDPQLEIFDKGIMTRTDGYTARLAWFVEARDTALREFIWIDAQTGAVLLNFSQLTPALSRRIYNANNTTTLPGTLVRSEGGPATGDVDADNAYLFSGITYNYFLSTHGRDSFDNAGAQLISTVHGCATGLGCPMANAFWNGTQMVYGNGYASADDVVGHELMHAVTERTAGLYYYNQSGALNESFSDIFGETIDLLSSAGGGNDTAAARWKMGEDLPIGAIRNMMDPGAFNHPARITDANFRCVRNAYTSSTGDRGGVHYNSGVSNHAYALMADGGTFNGQTISGIGLTKAAKVAYRALTAYLTSGSGFLDAFNALNQSCSDLIGSSGITSSDCAQVNKALVAVEMNAALPCSGAAQRPAMCAGGTPTFAFRDTFETLPNTNWGVTTTGSGGWFILTGIAAAGKNSGYGNDPSTVSDHRLTMTANVAVTAATRVYFDNLYEFESGGTTSFYDGGKLEYSTNNGASWNDANSLIDAGRNYSGTVATGFSNPIAGQLAFVGSTYGYTGTRLNLAPLAGTNVKFRFRIGSDSIVSSLGWIVDNFSIYTCPATAAPIITSHPGSVAVNAGQMASFSAAASGVPTPTVQWQVASGGSYGNIAGATSTTYSFTAAAADSGKTFRAVFTNSAGSATTSAATLTVNTAPVVTSNPANQTVNAGQTASFTAGALGSPAPTVQWQAASGGSYSNVPGATSLTYAFTAAVADNGKTYRAVFTNSAGSATTSAATLTVTAGAVAGDFDGDRKTDMTLYKPNGDWAVLRSTSAYMSSLVKTWGGSGYTAVTGDYDGDGKQDLAVYRRATGGWHILKSSTSYATPINATWGGPDYLPVPGDYDGDGKGDLAVYRVPTGQWLVLKSSSNYTSSMTANWGGTGYMLVPGQDFDGDGKSDMTLYERATGQWRILKSSSGFTSSLTLNWGGPGYMLVPGDYDGDGKADPAVYMRSTGGWHVLRSTSGFTTAFNKVWGGVGYAPVPGDYDGDGKFDLGVFQPSTGAWPVLKSSTGFTTTLSASGWGTAADIPVTTAIVTAANDVFRGGDFDGDGKSDITVYNTSTGLWSTLKSTGAWAAGMNTAWGGAVYTPTPGDFDGDAKADVGLYRAAAGTWHVLQSSTNFTTSMVRPLGGPGWAAVHADYDGDGLTDFVVYNAATSQWFGLKSSTGYTTTINVMWGGAGYTPVTADFDGDGRADIGVYHQASGNWHVLKSSANYASTIVKNVGGPAYVPVAADYDGDGKADFVVHNPSTGLWFGLKSSTNFATTINVMWGGAGYTPVKADFDGDGRVDLGVFRQSTGLWTALLSSTNYTSTVSKTWGAGAMYVPTPTYP